MMREETALTTYLLTWNPDKWKWTELPNQVKALARGETVVDEWSTGGRVNMEPGARLFILRQGSDPRGIFASGIATSHVYNHLTGMRLKRRREKWQTESKCVSMS